MTAQFIPPRVPLVDPKTGMITREWYLLFRSLFTNGDVIDIVTDDLSPSGADLDAVLALITDLTQPSAVAPISPSLAYPPMADNVDPQIGSLREEVAALTRRVDDLLKGSVVL